MHVVAVGLFGTVVRKKCFGDIDHQIGCLIYVGVIEDPLEHNTEYNSRRGLLAALFFW
jgi:hypothetical protein